MGCILNLFRRPQTGNDALHGSNMRGDNSRNNSIDSSEMFTPTGEFDEKTNYQYNQNDKFYGSYRQSVDISRDSDAELFLTMPNYKQILQFLKGIVAEPVLRENLEQELQQHRDSFLHFHAHIIAEMETYNAGTVASVTQTPQIRNSSTTMFTQSQKTSEKPKKNSIFSTNSSGKKSESLRPTTRNQSEQKSHSSSQSQKPLKSNTGGVSLQLSELRSSSNAELQHASSMKQQSYEKQQSIALSDAIAQSLPIPKGRTFQESFNGSEQSEENSNNKHAQSNNLEGQSRNNSNNINTRIKEEFDDNVQARLNQRLISLPVTAFAARNQSGNSNNNSNSLNEGSSSLNSLKKMSNSLNEKNLKRVPNELKFLSFKSKKTILIEVKRLKWFSNEENVSVSVKASTKSKSVSTRALACVSNEVDFHEGLRLIVNESESEFKVELVREGVQARFELTFQFDELLSQKVVSKDLSFKESTNRFVAASLNVRIQYIYDLKLLHEYWVGETDARIKQIDQFLAFFHNQKQNAAKLQNDQAETTNTTTATTTIQAATGVAAAGAAATAAPGNQNSIHNKVIRDPSQSQSHPATFNNPGTMQSDNQYDDDGSSYFDNQFYAR